MVEWLCNGSQQGMAMGWTQLIDHPNEHQDPALQHNYHVPTNRTPARSYHERRIKLVEAAWA